MARMEITGFEAYETLLQRLGESVNGIAEAGVYAGAKVIADAVRAEIEGLPIDNKWGTPEHPVHGLKKAQKKGLLEGFGISAMRDERGFINVKIGFEGYNDLRSRRWPKGQSNAMIARAAESGTSFSDKLMPMKKAIRKSKEQSVQAAQTAIDEKITMIRERI